MPRGIHDVTVSVPTYGNRRVTIIYPATSDGNNTPMTSGIKPVVMVGHGQIGNGSFSANGEGIGFAGSSYLHRSLTDLGYIVIAPHFTDVVNQMAEGTAVARFFLDYAIDTWTNGGQVNENAMGYAGTSMGGMIGYALMNSSATLNEPRLKAFFFRATSRLGSTSGTLLAGPALCHAHGTSDSTVSFSSGQSAYNNASSPKAFITLPGIGHDLVVTGPYYTNDANPAASGLGGFFGYFLKGDPDGLTVLETAVTNVTNPNTASIATSWALGTAPNVTSFSPASGAVGATVQINGTDFTNVNAVRFNGVNASYTVVSSIRIDAVVPSGGTDGLISVFTTAGSDSSATPFDVTSTPPSTPTIAWAGSHCIREVGTNQHTPATSLSQYTGARPQILGAMNVGCFTTFGLRIGWDHIETGRLLCTAGTAANSATVTVNNVHPALTNNQVLSFEAMTGSPVEVIVSGAHAANVTTVNVVASHAAVPANSRAGVYDFRVPEAAWTDITNLGYKFCIRIMNGKYTPTTLITDGSPIHAVNGGTATVAGFPSGNVYHEPYNSAGVTNPILIRAQRQLARAIFDWMDDKNTAEPGSIPIYMAGTIPGMQYAELWFGGQQQGGDYLAQLHGGSIATNKARMVTANSDLEDALVAASNGRYPIGFGISGLGALSDVIAPGIAQHSETTWGPFNTVVVFNANGWGKPTGETHIGEWGTTPSNEAVFDANVWSIDIVRGVQDISVTTARTATEWDTMVFQHAIGLQNEDAVWLEEYAYTVRDASGNGTGIAGQQANAAAWNQMVVDFNLFNDAVTSQERTVTMPLMSQAPVLTPPTFQTTANRIVAVPQLSQAPQLLNPPIFKMQINAGTLNQQPTLTAPSFGLHQTVTTPLLSQAPVLTPPAFQHTLVQVGTLNAAPGQTNPIFKLNVTGMGTLNQAPTLTAPIFARGRLVVTSTLDQSAAPNPPQFRMRVSAMGTLDAQPALTAPSFRLKVTMPEMDAAPATTAPQFRMRANVGTFDAQPVLIPPSFSVGSSTTLVSVPTLDASPVVTAPEFVQNGQALISKRGRYSPTFNMRASYDATSRRFTARYQRTTRLKARVDPTEE